MDEVKKGKTSKSDDIKNILTEINDSIKSLANSVKILTTVEVCKHTPKIKPGFKQCGLCKVGLEDPALKE